MNRKQERELVQEAYERGRALGRFPLVLLQGGGAESPPVEPGVRGVFQDVESFPGVVVIRCVDSAGRLRLKVEVPEAEATPAFIARLEHWLDVRDPERRLRAI